MFFLHEMLPIEVIITMLILLYYYYYYCYYSYLQALNSEQFPPPPRLFRSRSDETLTHSEYSFHGRAFKSREAAMEELKTLRHHEEVCDVCLLSHSLSICVNCYADSSCLVPIAENYWTCIALGYTAFASGYKRNLSSAYY